MLQDIHEDYLRSGLFGIQDGLVSTTGVVVGISSGVVASPDDTMIAFSRQISNPYDYNDLFVMDVNSKTERLVFRGEDGYLLKAVAFSPDKKRLAFDRWGTTQAKNTIMEVSVDGQDIRKLGEGGSFIGYSPDSNAFFAYIYKDGFYNSAGTYVILRVDLKTLEETEVGEINLDGKEIYGMRTSSNTNQLVFTAQYGESSGIYSYQALVSDLNGRSIKKLTDEVDTVYIPTFTPDGSKVVYVGQYKSKRSIKIINVDGTNSRTVVEQEN